VRVARGAGVAAGFPDEAWGAPGVELTDAATALDGAGLLACVRAPAPEAVESLPPGAVVAGLLGPPGPLLERLAARRLSALALERVPRITRAQPMDALSSQATLAGYKAVLVGASALGRILPMLTTAAGTLRPARVLVIGAGVAGLQAIATARRLGGVVSALDVRAAAGEQVRSLGAAFVEVPAVAGEGQGGYAAELQADDQARVLAAVAAQLPEADLVITTAQVPGRPAPRLLTEAMIGTMRPGAVVVDVAAESGGNCEPTRPGETVVVRGVAVIGAAGLAASVPRDASLLYARNLEALVAHLAPEGRLRLDPADEILGAMLVVHEGRVR
jgi:NAD(P) transhydrogenase subunit alpha